jgi:hypothetical protein
LSAKFTLYHTFQHLTTTPISTERIPLQWSWLRSFLFASSFETLYAPLSSRRLLTKTNDHSSPSPSTYVTLARIIHSPAQVKMVGVNFRHLEKVDIFNLLGLDPFEAKTRGLDLKSLQNAYIRVMLVAGQDRTGMKYKAQQLNVLK